VSILPRGPQPLETRSEDSARVSIGEVFHGSLFAGGLLAEAARRRGGVAGARQSPTQE